jgi:hypothetical protein
MIHYALRCDAAHEFDGWFNGSAGFEAQARAGLLECPVCASTAVQRALMAPSISPRAAAPALTPPASDAASLPASPQSPLAPNAVTLQNQAPARPADQMRAVLQRMRAEIEKNCDYVGPHFASEVRRMAENQQPSRPVYGEATPDEAAALADDGIDIARIPWVPRADS